MTGQPITTPFTLIDIMRGIRKHGLIDLMSEESFTFLVGLIMEADSLNFKNPMGFTINQTLPIGGGNSRQTLNSRRKTLKNFRLNGKQIVKITAGNHSQNSVATYRIDYELLCGSTVSLQGSTEVESNIIDGSATARQQSDDGSLTILYNNKGGQKAENAILPTQLDSKETLFWECMDKACPLFQMTPVNEFQRERINEILEYPDDRIKEVMARAGREGKSANKILDWILYGLVNYEKWYAKNGTDFSQKPTLSYKDQQAHFHQRDIDFLNNTYNDYKDGNLPDYDLTGAAGAHTLLKMKLSDVIKCAAEIDFTIEEYKTAMKLWEGRK